MSNGEIIVRIGDLTISNGPWGTTGDEWGNEWQLKELKGWTGAPAMKSAGNARLGQDGTYRTAPVMGGRTITIGGLVRIADDQTGDLAKDRLSQLLTSGDRYGLVTVEETSRGLVRQALVARDGELLADPYGQDHILFSIALFAPDPLRYNASEKATVTGRFVPSGGVSWPIVWPAVWGVGGAAGVVQADNAGSAPTWPLVTFAGPLTNPAVRIEGGPQLLLAMTLAAGEEVVIDTATRAVTMGGYTRRAFLSGDWFPLAPGASSVLFTADDGAGTMTLAYRDAWV